MEDFKYIKDYYKVPADMFREINMDGRKGIITEDLGNYIGVVFYDDKKLMPLPCHPTYKIEYLGTFNYKPPKPKNLASKQRYKDYLSMDGNLTFAEYLRIKKKK